MRGLFSGRLSLDQGKEKESAARIKMFMTIMDSMTDKELDCPNPKVLQEQSRVMRVARGAGCNPYCVLELLGARPLCPTKHPRPSVFALTNVHTEDLFSCSGASSLPFVFGCK